MGLGLSGLELMSVEWGGRRGGNEFMAIRSDPYAGVACVECVCVCVCEGGGSAAFVVFVTHCGGRRQRQLAGSGGACTYRNGRVKTPFV